MMDVVRGNEWQKQQFMELKDEQWALFTKDDIAKLVKVMTERDIRIPDGCELDTERYMMLIMEFAGTDEETLELRIMIWAKESVAAMARHKNVEFLL